MAEHSHAARVDEPCDRCGHMASCHGEDGCEVEVRDYGDTDCFCTGYVPMNRDPAEKMRRLEAWLANRGIGV